MVSKSKTKDTVKTKNQEEDKDGDNDDSDYEVPTVKKRKIQKVVVSDDHRLQIEEYFSSTIQDLKNPTKREIKEFETDLEWTQVKGVIHNIIKKRKKIVDADESKE